MPSSSQGKVFQIRCSHHRTPYINEDVYSRWLGRDTIGNIHVNEIPCLAMLDTKATVNSVSPAFVREHDLEVYPVSDLMGLDSEALSFDGIAGL